MDKYKNIIILILLIIAGFLIYGYLKSRPNPANGQNTQTQQPPANQNQSANLETKTNTAGGLVVDVTPIDLKPDNQIKLEIKFTTHQGDLNFDLLKQALLVDDKNQPYVPLSWDGGSGGHHLEGALIFPAVASDAKRIKLIIKNIYDIPEREFEWELN